MRWPESLLEVITSWGTIRVSVRRGRIASCDMPVLRRAPARKFAITSYRMEAVDAADRNVLHRARIFISAMMDGRRMRIPPFEIPEATPFLRRAWRELAKVRPGKTVTYAQLARRAGAQGAARAAGQACARNSLPLFIPCHRVLAAGGRLGGFSCGLPWKKLLLEREAT